jgi:hypothetical protein
MMMLTMMTLFIVGFVFAFFESNVVRLESSTHIVQLFSMILPIVIPLESRLVCIHILQDPMPNEQSRTIHFPQVDQFSIELVVVVILRFVVVLLLLLRLVLLSIVSTIGMWTIHRIGGFVCCRRVAELLFVLLEEVVADAVHAVVVEGWRTMILVGIDGYSRGLVIRATARASFSLFSPTLFWVSSCKIHCRNRDAGCWMVLFSE